MKLVSMITLYGGPSAELCLKNSAEETAGLKSKQQTTESNQMQPAATN